jgi:hypothetical protein
MGIADSSMIVLKIDIAHVLPLHAKSQAKITRHPDAPLTASATLERVQTPPRKLRDLLDVPSLFDRIHDDLELRYDVGANTARITLS